MKNINKRDILIFPRFQNIDLIQNVRKKYDKLANLIPPHITLVFPFTDEIRDDELANKLSELLKNYKPFSAKFNGISLSEDNYIFLNCIDGKNEIINLHDEIYNKILPIHLNEDIPYIPHITLGQSKSFDYCTDLRNFDYCFETIINEISIELIGNNEESFIIKNIQLL